MHFDSPTRVKWLLLFQEVSESGIRVNMASKRSAAAAGLSDGLSAPAAAGAVVLRNLFKLSWRETHDGDAAGAILNLQASFGGQAGPSAAKRPRTKASLDAADANEYGGAAPFKPAVRINAVDPDVIIQLRRVRECVACTQHGKKDLLQPRCLTSAPFLSGMRTIDAYTSPHIACAFVESVQAARGGTLREIARGLAVRRERRAASPAGEDRHISPLVVLQSAPGGGKSALLDVLSVMSAHAL